MKIELFVRGSFVTSVCYYRKYYYAVQIYAHVNVMIFVEAYIARKGAEKIRYHKIDKNPSCIPMKKFR